MSASQVWQVDTERLAAELLDQTRTSVTEEDVKMKVEPLLRRAFRNIGVDVDIAAYEKATAVTARRMDAVYGHLIIEYKAPGRLAAPAAVRDVQDQLRAYLEDQARQHASPEGFLEKAVGVAIDGTRVLFARYSTAVRILSLPVPIESEAADLFPEVAPQRGFHFQGPYPIGPRSLANLLVYVRSAGRRPLTAADLATAFGPDHPAARLLVSELYSCATRGQRRSQYPRAATFYDEWSRIFGVVYGEKLDKAEKAAETTAALYGLPSGVRLKHLLFAIHTFYAFLMKLIAIELLALQRDTGVSSFVTGLAAHEDEEVRQKLADLEAGGGFVERGIANFLEADFFSWYLDVWSARLAEAIRGVVRALDEFEPATPVLEPDWTRDLLQKLYELLVPKVLRHGLGEYYTPDWLAGYLVDLAGYDGAPGARFLDPACGSGTFLVHAIHRAARHAEKQPRVRVAEVGRSILNGVVGFDLNPLAVLAARTNYLIAFARFLPYVRPLSIPVYLCDSVVPPDGPSERNGQRELFADTVVFRTHEHDYVFPLSMRNKERIDLFTGQVMVGLRGKLEADRFRRMLAAKLPLPADEAERLVAIYATIKRLDDEKRDGIWAHYIKNAFAPVYVGRFDYVVGNPPWIRWGYLAAEYRQRTLRLWQDYGLFSLKGHDIRLGAGEKDFSMLFTYACADRYLKDGGTLGFVITQEVFKSKGAGEGFRRFRIGEAGPALKIAGMEDLVHLQPFQAANKTCLFTLRKGAATRYPVPVVEWRRKAGIGTIAPGWTLAETLRNTERVKMQAVPVDPQRPVSSWQTARAAQLRASSRMKGTNAYVARLGARVEPYGVFWLRLDEVLPNGQIAVTNRFDRGKRKVHRSSATIEADLVYPAVSGGEIARFGVRQPFYVLISQDAAKRAPYPEEWMLDRVPLTFAYLRQFERILLSRGSNAVRQLAERTAFYAMFGIGPYTFARYRVAWKRMAARMSAVVLDGWKTPFGFKTLVATDTVSFFTARTAREAHYLCAILNSGPVDRFIRSFSAGGRGFGAPSVMKNLAIPAFDESLAAHAALAALSEKAHAAVRQGRDTTDLDAELDRAVEELWTAKP